MSSLPARLHSAAQVRDMDARAVEALRIPSYELMSRAGEAALAVLRTSWPAAQKIIVACGPGNNAGDGYVLARLALADRLEVSVMAVTPPRELTGDALRACNDYEAAGGAAKPWDPELLSAADVLVDALFGVGLSRSLDKRWCEVIARLNEIGVPILSLDVPSGLDADNGAIRGAAIHATRTVVFLGLKVGLYLGAGPECAGVVMFDDLGVPASLDGEVGHLATRLDATDLAAAFPRRRRDANKGEYGHVLIVAGGRGMAGAARLAGEACLRSGAGRVTVATQPENVIPLVAGRPELMVRGVETVAALEAMLERIDVIAIGPGLGQDDWARALFRQVLDTPLPLVVDADALNLLALAPVRRERWILTPHPGEAGRLLGSSASDVQEDRLDSVRKLAERYGGIAVLKGAGTLVFREGGVPALCAYGNPGMAAAGMGDVLTGIIAGLVAQTRDLWTAATAGVLLHALAGDAAARRGERGLLASDLFTQLPAFLNPSR